jgi:flagellar export protein FliJ
MSESLRKIKKVFPVIRARQLKVDAETALLQKIREEKTKIVSDMRNAQQKYMKGVSQLNQLRNAATRNAQDGLETGLDFVKDEWYRLFTAVQEVERREKMQISQLLEAEKDLKATEKLKERYENDYAKEVGKAEQKRLDEAALRKFVTGS